MRQCRDADSTDVRAHWLFRELFNHVALSPYTDFCDRLLDALLALATPSEPVAVTAVADTMSYMLRHLCRHLTAFDLKLFHNFGANYPDALFLDGLLKAYLRLVDSHPLLWIGTPQDDVPVAHGQAAAPARPAPGVPVRKHYEGHRVPDAPTSMGENLRVLPPPFVRVPDEQIMQAAKRRRSLYDGESLESMLSTVGRDALEASLADLAHLDELTELGLAQFLDRPLGVTKQPGEVDRTPLVSCEAFSRSIARRRLGEMQTSGWLSQHQHLRHVTALDTLSLAGVPISELSCAARPGVVSLADAAKAATDFVILRTSRNSLADFVEHYDWAPLAKLAPGLLALLTVERRAIVVHFLSTDAAQTPGLAIYDCQGRRRLELGFDRQFDGVVSYVERGGLELVERLHVLRIYEPTVGGELAERDLREQAIWLELRRSETRASVATDHP